MEDDKLHYMLRALANTISTNCALVNQTLVGCEGGGVPPFCG